MSLIDLSTKALLEGLTALLGTERQTLARLVVHLAEVEERRAHLEIACSSMFDFCTRKLGLSEGEAFRRINAARLARRFPVIITMIESGQIHLSALALLRDHLSDENHLSLLGEAAGKSKSALKELLAARSPRPDVEASIRQLPTRTPNDVPERATLALRAQEPAVAGASSLGARSLPTSQVEPLSAARFKIHFTGSADLKEKLERAGRLMSHRHSESDFASVVERALDVLIDKLERERFGKTTRPQTRRGAKPEHVTNASRREVVARDGERCAYVSEDGERCPARARLEFDHRHPRALGGTGEACNVRLFCQAHNQLAAERVFGRDHIARKVDLRRRKRSERLAAGAEGDSAPTNAATSSACVFERATCALKAMGFRKEEAAGAVRAVRRRHEAGEAQGSGPTPPVEEVLREALLGLERASRTGSLLPRCTR